MNATHVSDTGARTWTARVEALSAQLADAVGRAARGRDSDAGGCELEAERAIEESRVYDALLTRELGRAAVVGATFAVLPCGSVGQVVCELNPAL
jgi:hypothetical protein